MYCTLAKSCFHNNRRIEALFQGRLYTIIRQDVVLISPMWFLPRDAMHKRGLCRHAVSVCLSVYVSVTFVDCVKTNKHIFEIVSPLSSHAILVFPYQTKWRYSDGNPPNGGVECRCNTQKSRFWAYTPAVDAATGEVL